MSPENSMVVTKNQEDHRDYYTQEALTRPGASRSKSTLHSVHIQMAAAAGAFTPFAQHEAISCLVLHQTKTKRLDGVHLISHSLPYYRIPLFPQQSASRAASTTSLASPWTQIESYL